MQAIVDRSRHPGLDSAELDGLRRELEQELLSLTGGRDRAEGGTEFLGAASQARARTLLAALGRMRDGSYGTCRRCRTAIPYPRLAAIPETTTCVVCAEGRR